MCGEVAADLPGLAKKDSALRHNQEQKGQNSYYYAHTRAYEVPEDAKVVSGPGLITGGPPVLLSTEEAKPVERAVVPIRNYAWSEEDETVTVSVDGEGTENATDGNTKAEFTADTVVCTLALPGRTLQLKIQLKKEVDPNQCKLRISKGKGIRLKLVKAAKGKWYDLCKTGK